MNDIVRKLVTVEKITNLEPIENADRIELASVRGWKAIVEKGKHLVGEFIVFLEIDSFLPVREEFEFLRKSSFKSTKNLGDGFRIKTMKMKNVISQGLICSISDFPELENISLQEGDDLTELLKVQKYEKPIPACLYGTVKGNFPYFLRKTNQERYQNLSQKDKNLYKDIPFEMSIKMDGTSMTVYYKDGEFGVCSRNLELKDDSENNFSQGGKENLYWKVAKEFKFKEILDALGKNLAFQMELCGPGIQGNPLKLKEHVPFLFDIYDINNQRYFSPFEREVLLDYINYEFKYKINICPFSLIYFGDTINNKDFVHSLADNIKCNDIPMEGIVFKSMCGRYSFKMISNNYILNNS